MQANSGPLVSVVVTTRNSARTLETCLKSIRAQTYSPIELIVVDNHSGDVTRAIAGRYADQVTTVGPERSVQRNAGARLATGAYFLFIDADMALDPGVVSDGVGLLRAGSMPAAIIPEQSVGVGFWTRCRTLERSCYTGDDHIEAARLYRRDVFTNAGGFDPDITGAEDWDLSRRVARGARLPRTDAVIRHDEGRTRVSVVYAKRRYYAPGYLRYLRKHGRDVAVQGNPILRTAYVRHWRALARHPVLTAGMFTLKCVELAAVVDVATRDRLGVRAHNPVDLYGQP
jgi:glycosyltransferase involved in cell wall biosynthesis